MKQITFNSRIAISLVLCLITLSLTLATTTYAQCGGSLDAMAATVLSTQNKGGSELISSLEQKGPSYSLLRDDSDEDGNSTIVGLWHVQFNVTPPGEPPVTIQEAFQIWNAGGTEVHNPNGARLGGLTCLGAWIRKGGTFKLVHRVWNHAPDGTFLGTINLTETVRVVDRGRRQTGSFSLEFFDPAGNPTPPVRIDGDVVGERISPE